MDKNCLENRTYEDFVEYMKQNPNTPIVEVNTVEGRKRGKVLLTLHFVNCSFTLAFIREHNDAQSVIDIFNYLQNILGIDKFKELFILILTDNCSEFSNPTKIEFDLNTGEKEHKYFIVILQVPMKKDLVRSILSY